MLFVNFVNIGFNFGNSGWFIKWIYILGIVYICKNIIDDDLLLMVLNLVKIDYSKDILYRGLIFGGNNINFYYKK